MIVKTVYVVSISVSPEKTVSDIDGSNAEIQQLVYKKILQLKEDKVILGGSVFQQEPYASWSNAVEGTPLENAIGLMVTSQPDVGLIPMGAEARADAELNQLRKERYEQDVKIQTLEDSVTRQFDRITKLQEESETRADKIRELVKDIDGAEYWAPLDAVKYVADRLKELRAQTKEALLDSERLSRVIDWSNAGEGWLQDHVWDAVATEPEQNSQVAIRKVIDDARKIA